jgi:hypothetical protein
VAVQRSAFGGCSAFSVRSIVRLAVTDVCGAEEFQRRLFLKEDAHDMGPDPSLYASTGSWAGLPYDTPSYGPPPGGGGYYSYAAPAAEYGPPGGYGPPPPMPPMPPMGGPPADGVYSSFRPTGPARMVGSSMVGGGPPPGGGYMSYGMPPPGYQYGDPYGPPAQPRQKVYGVRDRPLPTPLARAPRPWHVAIVICEPRCDARLSRS